jgi:hypothetical protein
MQAGIDGRYEEEGAAGSTLYCNGPMLEAM